MTEFTSYLDVHNNKLNGTVPTNVGKLTKMSSYLDLSCNTGDSSKLSGPVPTEVGSMSLLSNYLNLQNCALTGTVPTQVGGLTGMQELFDLQGNTLHGTLPTQVCGDYRGSSEFWHICDLSACPLPTPPTYSSPPPFI